MKPTNPPNCPSSLPYLLLFICFAVYPSFGLHAQEILTKANQFNELYKQEKIYLHIDRPSYWANDDMWFKAYLKDSPKAECNLYVELLNERGAVIYKNTCWAQNGIAYGDIHLADTLSSGMYQVRAYTDWMRNFDEQWFFRRDMVKWNLRDKAKPAEQKDLTSKNVDFRFLPEGGTFLSGVKNKVAFKAVDSNGKGLDVNGVVLDEKNEQVAMIKSGYKGMGSFEIIPEPGKKYLAVMTVAGNIPMKTELPEAMGAGVSMSFDIRDTSHIRLQVNEQGIPDGGKYLLVGQSAGKVCYQEEVSVSSGTGVMEIDINKFPTGIVRFTLFDDNNLPRCERLVFINHHDPINLAIEAEEEEYHPREKVILDIIALDKDENPMLANLSVSAYPTETVHQTESYPENILTRFLLSSELKGRIEEPGYYFKDDSISTFMALDNLMLTHGYRYFDWKQVMDNKQPAISYQPESGIQLKGTVLSDLLHRPVPHAKITMMTVKSLLSLHEQTSDENGNFVFPDLFFNDTLHVVLQMKKENGNAVSGIDIKETSSISPNASILPLTYNYSKEDNFQTVSYLSDLSPELLNRKWHLSDTILLGDVNVKAWKKKKWDGIVRPYVEAEYVIEVSKLGNIYSNIDDLMETGPAILRSFMNLGCAQFLDGFPDRFGLLNNIPVSLIDKIELVRMAPIPGKGIGPGIYFYTKRGAPNEIIEYSPGIRPVTLMGFSVVRNYYSPVYDGTKDEQSEKMDYRSSIHWEPNINTDSEGLTWVSFYNSDQLGEVQVVVEGVTKEGKICRGEYKYNVIPKQIP